MRLRTKMETAIMVQENTSKHHSQTGTNTISPTWQSQKTSATSTTILTLLVLDYGTMGITQTFTTGLSGTTKTMRIMNRQMVMFSAQKSFISEKFWALTPFIYALSVDIIKFLNNFGLQQAALPHSEDHMRPLMLIWPLFPSLMVISH